MWKFGRKTTKEMEQQVKESEKGKDFPQTIIKFVVTGGAGFIGSHIVEELNRKGHHNIVIVDDFSDANKLLNLKGLKYYKLIDINEKQRFRGTGWGDVDSENFYDSLSLSNNIYKGTIVFHAGAISSTTESGIEIYNKNINATNKLIDHVIYTPGTILSLSSSASVYGNSTNFSVNPENENPINAYAMSKKMIDDLIREDRIDDENSRIQAWRYFNVYGEREDHKDGMRSMVTKFIQDDKPALFYKSKDVSRDFIYVKDVARVQVDSAMTLYEGHRKNIVSDISKNSGVFNLGTGVATNVQEIADKVKEKRVKHDPKFTFKRMDMPEKLKGKYQYHTKADMTKTPIPYDIFANPMKFKTVFQYIDEQIPDKENKNETNRNNSKRTDRKVTRTKKSRPRKS